VNYCCCDEIDKVCHVKLTRDEYGSNKKQDGKYAVELIMKSSIKSNILTLKLQFGEKFFCIDTSTGILDGERNALASLA